MEVVNQMRVRLFIFLVLFTFAFAPSSMFAQATCSPQPCPAPSLGGTSFEISPYGGYVWIGSNDSVGSFKNNQIIGVRGGGYITPNFELGGNYSWNNHFQPSSGDNPASSFAGALGFPQGSIRGNLWEVELTYNFGRRGLLGSTAVVPYVVAGGGGITTSVKNSDVFVLNTRAFESPFSPSTLQNALQNGNLQNFAPGIDTTDGVRFFSSPTGSTVVVANTVMDNRTFFTFSYGGGLKAQRLWGPMGLFGDFRGRTIPNFFNGHGLTYPEISAGLNFSWGEK
jgi:hypothetical protein